MKEANNTEIEETICIKREKLIGKVGCPKSFFEQLDSLLDVAVRAAVSFNTELIYRAKCLVAN